MRQGDTAACLIQLGNMCQPPPIKQTKTMHAAVTGDRKIINRLAHRITLKHLCLVGRRARVRTEANVCNKCSDFDALSDMRNLYALYVAKYINIYYNNHITSKTTTTQPQNHLKMQHPHPQTTTTTTLPEIDNYTYIYIYMEKYTYL